MPIRKMKLPEEANKDWRKNPVTRFAATSENSES